MTWPTAASEFFVSLQGSDASSGTSQNTAFRTIQKGVDALVPGDTLTIGPGEYFENVCRTNLGNAVVETVIRAEVPGTALLRGDVPAPEFHKTAGFQFIYAAEFHQSPTAVLEHDTLHTLVAKSNLQELEFDPGFFYYDTAAEMLYISSSDLRSPAGRPYSVAVNGNSGLELTTPQRTLIEGLATTGFYPNWGIALKQPVFCTVRNCTSFMNVGGIVLEPINGVAAGDGGSNNVIENCNSYGHTFGGIVRYGADNDVIRNCQTYQSKTENAEYFGIMHYAEMSGPLMISNNISWGQNFDYSVKPVQQERLERNVSLGFIRINLNSMDHNLFGNRNEYDGSLVAPVDNILLMREQNLDQEFEYADPLNLDFRLQPDSRFRNTAPDGSDRGPYPYKANIFYIAPNGSDQASGLSMRAPWRTLAHALESLSPGDTLYLAGGTYSGANVVWNMAGDGSAPITICGRGRDPVLISSGLVVAHGQNIVFERLHFNGGITLQQSQGIAFDNCSFFNAIDGLSADGVQGLKVTHGLFKDAALALTSSSNVFLSGNLYDHANAWAIRMDAASAISYSDYNNYTETLQCWQVDSAPWSLADLQQASHDHYSLGMVPEFALATEVPTLLNPAQFEGRGPLSTALGIYHAYKTDGAAMGVAGPLLHSVDDTTANIEWWGSNPATYSLAWWEAGSITTNLVRWPSPSRFTTFSLTGLMPGHAYAFQLRTADPSGFDVTETIPVLTLEDAPLLFTTAPSAVALQNYYVAPDGDDSNTGLSRGQAFRTVNRAADRVRAGDTVMISEGEYAETVRIRTAGTPDRPILFRSITGEKVVFKGAYLNQAFEVSGKPDIRLDGLYFDGYEWSGVVLRSSDRVQITRCFGLDVEAAHSAGLLIKNCVLHGQWSDFAGASLSGSTQSQIENNVFLMTLILHIRSDDAQAIFRNNIFCENIRGKVHQNLVSLPSNAVESNNCFYVRWPESERLTINSQTLPQRRVRIGSDSLAANPMMPGVRGWRQGWQQDDAIGCSDYFATNPEVVRRGIGLQPQAFEGFSSAPSDWPYDALWAEDFITHTNAAALLVQAGENLEALTVYTNLAASVLSSARLRADLLDQAALCADRTDDFTLAMTLAASIPIQPMAIRRRMALMLQREQYVDLLAQYAESQMGGYSFHLSYIYPELEDLMADLYYYRSIAYAETGDLPLAEADLKLMNSRRFELQYRAGEAIHDLVWLRLGDFYRQYYNDAQALAAYSNILSRTTWAPWADSVPKPLATGSGATLVAATERVCEILEGRGLHAQTNGVWFNLRKAQAEAAADLLDKVKTLSAFAEALALPGIFIAEMQACEARINILEHSRTEVVETIAAMVVGLTDDARDILVAAAVGVGPQERLTGLRALLLFVPLASVNELLDRTEAIFYVALEGGHRYPYKSWADAATNIQDVISLASKAAGSVVWVSNGVYRLTHEVFVGDFKLRSWPNGVSCRNTTVIDGNFPTRIGRCLTINHTNALVEGFTITNGCTSASDVDGAGCKVYAGTIRNCLVTGNREMNTYLDHPIYAGGQGGGIWVRGSSTSAPLIMNCEITANTAIANGGGICMDSGMDFGTGPGIKVWNCNVSSNTAAVGGGIYCRRKPHEILNSQIVANSASESGSGLSLWATTVMMRNCLVGHNDLYLEVSTLNMDNCTVVGNINRPWNPSDINMTNTILMGSISMASHAGISFYNFKNSRLSSLPENTDPLIAVTISDCMTIDPMFVNASSGDYRLDESSPCVNTGTNQPWMNGSFDLRGAPRIGDGVVDRGAYERPTRGSSLFVR